MANAISVDFEFIRSFEYVSSNYSSIRIKLNLFFTQFDCLFVLFFLFGIWFMFVCAQAQCRRTHSRCGHLRSFFCPFDVFEQNRDDDTHYEIEITAIYCHLNRNALPEWIEPSNHDVFFIFVLVMFILVKYITFIFFSGWASRIALEANPSIKCCVDDLNWIWFFVSRKAQFYFSGCSFDVIDWQTANYRMIHGMQVCAPMALRKFLLSFVASLESNLFLFSRSHRTFGHNVVFINFMTIFGCFILVRGPMWLGRWRFSRSTQLDRPLHACVFGQFKFSLKQTINSTKKYCNRMSEHEFCIKMLSIWFGYCSMYLHLTQNHRSTHKQREMSEKLI